jgi:hypothetical protein
MLYHLNKIFVLDDWMIPGWALSHRRLTDRFNRGLLSHDVDLTKTLELIIEYKNYFLTNNKKDDNEILSIEVNFCNVYFIHEHGPGKDKCIRGYLLPVFNKTVEDPYAFSLTIFKRFSMGLIIFLRLHTYR